MKNLKIYKSVMALASASILLLSGCSASTNTTEEKEETCTHLTIYFEDEAITFKECEGYELEIRRFGKSSDINYNISKNDKKIFEGYTTNYNGYEVNHSEADNMFDNPSIQKIK